MALITVNNVTYQYRTRYIKVDALRGVSCEFEQGMVYSITGRSGSGKTTLLSLLAGLDNPTTGDIIFDGKSLSSMNMSKYRREQLSVIFQNFQLFPLLNAVENVMYPMTQLKVKSSDARKKAEELLLMMGLTKRHFKQFPSMLSGGEQQRVAIARAMGNSPKLVLADEPTGNLDTQNSEHTINTLINLARTRNCCVIIVTHDNAISERADRVVRISDGHIVQ